MRSLFIIFCVFGQVAFAQYEVTTSINNQTTNSFEVITRVSQKTNKEILPPTGALIAKTLKDFKFEDSLVFPRGAGPEIKNIEQVAPYHFKFILRHRGTWYDGDRDLRNNDKGLTKSRAELGNFMNLPAQYAVGQTWLIGTTFKVAKDFRPSAGYCNIMQPSSLQSFLSLTKLSGETITASLFMFKQGVGTPISTVRTFTFKRDEWVTVWVKYKVAEDGYYGLSVNGDEFVGQKYNTLLSHATRKAPFFGTWGLYGSAIEDTNGNPLGDQVVEHKNMFIKKL